MAGLYVMEFCGERLSYDLKPVTNQSSTFTDAIIVESAQSLHAICEAAQRDDEHYAMHVELLGERYTFRFASKLATMNSLF